MCIIHLLSEQTKKILLSDRWFLKEESSNYATMAHSIPDTDLLRISLLLNNNPWVFSAHQTLRKFAI